MHQGPGNTWTAIADPRITGIGKILRVTRLDELPQFINLLQGNMSLVGPRPEQVHFVDMLKQEIPFFDERHWVKPGLTGWAQLNVYASTLEETKRKLQYDLYYIKHQSILFDLEIILKTFYHIIMGKGR
jgi:lipopolysaccharide/colanic/teichoic acid biosynthesis glycosyltransferase